LRTRRKDQARKRNHSDLRNYSFVITILIIAIFVGSSYFQSLPKVGHIPADFAFRTQDWMAYVPGDSEYAGYVNHQQAVSVSHNGSLFGNAALFELPQLGFQILPTDITYEVVVQLPEPRYSGSASILQLNNGKEADLTVELASPNVTAIHTPLKYAGHQIYGLLVREFGDKTSSQGFIAIVNGHLIFSNDKNSALRNVQAIIDKATSNGNGLFDQVNVRQATYAAGVNDKNYVALFVGRFPTQLNNTEMAVKSVTGEGDSLQVSRALLFSSSDIALQRLDQAHQVYKNASSYSILDSWLVVSYSYPLSRTEAEILGI
jgi:hypothetical protein